MVNQLAHSMSPYLQSHADNPVDWWPWGEQALAEAGRRDVPLLISVGYAACHWCHVMAHESFEDPVLAAVINEHTVPVKVDREERPDIDAVYMQATVAMTGQGGWPMTVFAAPDGTPFHAGTYYPREQFRQLLDAVTQAWTQRRDDVMQQGAAVVQACAAAEFAPADVSRVCPVGGPCPPVSPVDAEVLDRAAATLLSQQDPANGGFGGAPKFPTQPALGFLLQHHRRTGEAASLEMVARTGERMARGGIYDQLAGGFARYSVDATWTVPHFEKMLYDNALLLQTFLDLEQLASSPAGAADGELFGRVADQTAAFLMTVLGTVEGGFAAALDADTDGEEGSTYVWTPRQLIDVLGEADGRWAAEIFGVTPAGTFADGASVLQFRSGPSRPAGAADSARFGDVRARLMASRSLRPQPMRDDKVVAAWNGMAISALSGYAAERGSGEADAAAEAAAVLLRDLHLVDGRLRRVSRGGTVGDAAGVLEDYAATATAFLARHRASGDPGWLAAAADLLDTVAEHFTDSAGNLHDTADDADIVVTRLTDPTDGPTPSGSALAADAFRRLAAATGDGRYADQAWRTVAATVTLIEAHPRFAGGLADVAERMLV